MVVLCRGLALVFVLMLTACAMVESNFIDLESVASSEGPKRPCSSDAGYYYLPKTMIRLEVTAENDATYVPTKDPTSHVIKLSRLRVTDKRFGFCLDYRHSASSNDVVQIAKYSKTPILGMISSKAIDQSRYIFQTLIHTLFVGISGNAGYRYDTRTRSFQRATTEPVTVFRAEFDPFDPREMARINQGAKDFGFCLVFEHFTFNLKEGTIDNYCDAPERLFARAPVRTPDYRYAEGPKFSEFSFKDGRGIFYRPRTPHTYYLFIKRNMKVAGGWAMAQTGKIEMENIAPILSVGVDRTFFAERRTILAFDEGALANVCILKQSELEQFVAIPLQVVQAIVALPANIIQVRIWDVNNDAALISAQNRLVAEQIAYLEKLGGFKLPAATLAASNPGTQLVLPETDKPKYEKLQETVVDVAGTPLATDWANICKSMHLGTGDTANVIVPPNLLVLGGQ